MFHNSVKLTLKGGGRQVGRTIAALEAAKKSATFRLWVQFVPKPGLIEVICDRCHYRVIGIYRNVPLQRPLIDALQEHKCRK